MVGRNPASLFHYQERELGDELLRVEEINFNSAYTDASEMRECLGFEFLRAAGAPASSVNVLAALGEKPAAWADRM